MQNNREWKINSVLVASAAGQLRQKAKLRLIFTLTVIILLNAFFGMLALAVVSNSISFFDNSITRLVTLYQGPYITGAAKFITFWGSSKTLSIIALAVIAALYAWGRPLREKSLVAVSTAGSILLFELLKLMFHRPRPDINQLVQVSGYSFPSGHATVSTAVYGAAAYLLWTRLPAWPGRRFAAGGLALLVLIIGLTRIYLGVHYPSDVLAGFAAGGAWLAVCLAAWWAADYLKKNNQ